MRIMRLTVTLPGVFRLRKRNLGTDTWLYGSGHDEYGADLVLVPVEEAEQVEGLGVDDSNVSSGGPHQDFTPSAGEGGDLEGGFCKKEERAISVM